MSTSTSLPGANSFLFAFDPPAERKPRPRTKRADSPADPRHHLITSQWSERFQHVLGIAYVFTARDAASLKRFLAASGEGSEAILRTAEEAWTRVKVDRYATRCKMAATLHGLCSAYNDIRVELRSPAKSSGCGMRNTGLGRSGVAMLP